MNQKLLTAIQTHQALSAMRDSEFFMMPPGVSIALEEKIQQQSDLVLNIWEELNPGFKDELLVKAKEMA